MTGLAYKLNIPASGGVFAEYTCDKCGSVENMPYFMYQRGERVKCKRGAKLVKPIKTSVKKSVGQRRVAFRVGCSVNGVEYRSINDAAKALGVDAATVRRRFAKFPNEYKRLD